MSNEEKAKSLWYHFCTEKSCGGYDDCKLCSKAQSHPQLMEMATWKDTQLDKAFDKALEHHANKLKEGKITQYGMDNVFAFVENVRYILSHEC